MSRRVGGEGGPWMLKQVQHDEGRNGKHPSMKGGRLPLALRPLRIGIAERARLALDLRQAAGVTLYRRSGAALIVLAADILALDRALGFLARQRLIFEQRAREQVQFIEMVGQHLARGGFAFLDQPADLRSEEHTSELQSLMRSSYAVFCLKTK